MNVDIPATVSEASLRAPSEYVLPLADARFSPTPYPLLWTDCALEPRLADDVLDWMETGIEWDLHAGEFFEQWERDLLQCPHPPSVAPLFRQDVLDDLARRVGDVFGTPMSSRMTVVAHKLVRGQEIGVHNDDPDVGYETHRLVVQLNRSRHSGGRFRVHASRNASDVIDAIDPVHNCAVAFAMSSRSWHSVEAMGDWSRYSLIYSFWSKQAAAQAERPASETDRPRFSAADVVASLDPREVDRLEKLVTLLTQLGAGDTAHSRASLVEHLVATYLILRSWRCGVELATAGLFHSVYGTGSFHLPLLSLDDRRVLAELIGERAERLAFLFCVATKDSLFANVARQDELSVSSNRSGDILTISRGELQDLLTLDLANALEQHHRVGSDEAEASVLDDPYETASELLPREAIAWLHELRAVSP
jgi:hypothetical protein